jgi:hypothetical protein
MNDIAVSLEIAQEFDICLPGKSGFKSKVPALVTQDVDLFEDNPAGLDRCPFRYKRGKPAGDEICVDEFQALHVIG